MNGTVEEWLAKSEGDYRTSARELSATESPNYDAACYHAQQCIEKLMKALLIHRGTVPPRTHELLRLSELVRVEYPQWACAKQDVRFLTRAGMAFRYPGDDADRKDAEKALTICTRLRTSLLTLIAPDDAGE